MVRSHQGEFFFFANFVFTAAFVVAILRPHCWEVVSSSSLTNYALLLSRIGPSFLSKHRCSCCIADAYR